MVIADLLELAADALAAGAACPAEEARREAQSLLAAALGIGRANLVAHAGRHIGGAELARVRDWLARRARGEPLAYLSGTREFWSLPFRVTPDVLVPRPETEQLVSRALELGDALAARAGGTPALADLGTGSGCIALALAHERPAWRVTATDASPAALQVARANAQALGLAQVEFLEGPWFAPLAGRRFDLLVSNPPYIGVAEAALDDPALRHEPRMALTTEGDGLDALRQIIDGAARHLEPGGWLILEHGAGQGPHVAAMLVARGFRHVRCAPDLAGHDRVASAQRPLSTQGLP